MHLYHSAPALAEVILLVRPVPQRLNLNANDGLGCPTVVHRVALNSYNPANLCQNYLGDSGVVGLGTTVSNVSYSFVVPAHSDFFVVVNTTGTTTFLGILWDRLGIFRLHSGTWPLSRTLVLQEQAHVGGESLRGSVFEPR